MLLDLPIFIPVMHVDLQISLQVPAFSSFGYIPRSGIAEPYGLSAFNCIEVPK